MLRAAMVNLAGGPRYLLQSKLGMGRPRDFLKTAQVDVPVRNLNETKIFTGSRVAPGSFAWAVPFEKEGQKLARVGVSSKTAAAPYLRKLLKQLRRDGYLESEDFSIRSWVIPIAPPPRTYSDRVLAVGDAAGQTKPMTGGGIYHGLVCSELAANAVSLAFAKSDFGAKFQARYEEEWQRRLDFEMTVGSFFRTMAERLTDQEMDKVFRIAQSDGILSSAEKLASFDWHSGLIALAFRHPSLGLIFCRRTLS
jgi:flavin-dependent dehydrogenase